MGSGHRGGFGGVLNRGDGRCGYSRHPWFITRVLGGVVAYSNDCKVRLLGVSADLIAEFGAVSREVARAMAIGALALREPADNGAGLALAITGIAGPEGGSPEKPVGLVWFAFCSANGQAFEESAIFSGDRNEVRKAATERALIRAAALAIDRY